MPRGGSRERAGRKTGWSSGCRFEDTKSIRVPKAIADRLLEIAHKIDEGYKFELVSKSEVSDKSALDLETNSKEFLNLGNSPQREQQLSLIELDTNPKTISTKLLALRLDMRNYNLSKLKRNKGKFRQESQRLDPDGIVWIPLRSRGKYRTSKKTTPEQHQALEQWISENS